MSPWLSAAKITVIMGGSGMMTLLPMAVVVALPSLSQEFGGAIDGALLAQFILAIPSLLVAVGAPLAAWAAQRVGMRNAIVLSIALYVLAGLLSMVAPSLAILIAARVVLGLTAGAAATLAVAVVADFPEERRHTMIGLNGAGGALIGIVALLLTGWLLDRFGWRATFGVYLLGVPVLVAAWFGVANVKQAESTGRSSILAPLKLMPGVYLMVVLMTIGYFTPTIETAFVLADQGASSGAELGSMMLFYAASSTVFAFAYGPLRRRLDSRAMTVLCLVSLAVACLMMGLVRGQAMIAVALIVAGAGGGLTAPTINSIILDRAPEAVRAAAFGLMVSFMFVAQAATPFVLGALRGQAGMYGGLALIGAAMAALAVACFATGFGRRPAAAPAE